MKVKIFTDGGSRGNPGVAGFGVVVFNDKNEIIFKNSGYLGIKTNNEAEYGGLISAVEWLKENEMGYKMDEVEFNADSELMIKQMQGIYKVKAGNLRDLYLQVTELLLDVKSKISFKAIRREYNSLADELANEAMDRKL